MRRLAIIAVLTQAIALRALAQSVPVVQEPTAAPAAPVAAAAPPADAPATTPAPAVQHLPLHAAFTGQAELRFTVHEPDRAGSIVVRCKLHAASARVHSAPAQRAEIGYVARVPAACALPPGFGYWVVSAGESGEQPLFASAAAPHPVRVTDTPEREGERERLRASGNKRSRVLLAAEGVSFGDRRPVPGAAEVHDRYYRLEAGYGYAFFETIEDIALTLVRVRGENGAAELSTGTPGLEPGIDYGRATVTLLVTDQVRTRGSLLLGASQEGFEYGASGELVLGDPFAENLMLGGETLTTLGTTVYLRLGFSATSAIPMGARVEITDFPLGEDAAVRLLYEIGYRFDPATELMLRAGYQGRTSVVGGPSLGLAMRYGF